MKENAPATEIHRIHLVFKTHLDVGFTDLAGKVVENYFNHFIPAALDLAERQRLSGSPERFLWTTGSWLIYEYLEQASPAGRKRMEAAIAAGDIAWHALPFTVHSENMDPQLFRFGLSLSQELDRRFGKQTIAAKMTDVPGHTRGIVPLLAEAGVLFLHIGVNAASTPPDVPPVFVWREPSSGAELMVMYHKGSYGELMIVPGLEDAISFAHTNDNLGPQSPEELHHTYEEMQRKFPQAEVTASTMDRFAARLLTIKDRLPVIEQEIGDTWIHGAASDPQKEARYRELLRLRRDWTAEGHEAEITGFQRKLMMVPEHTWGMDIKTHLKDWTNYLPADFQSVRGQPNFQAVESSWQEQRAYLDQAIEALPAPLKQQAQEHLAGLAPEKQSRQAFEIVADPAQPLTFGPFQVSIDPAHGHLTGLDYHGVQWGRPQNPLARFWYETFSAADYRRFYQHYVINKRATHWWSVPDLTKPGIEPYAVEHKRFQPRLDWAGQCRGPQSDQLLLALEMPEESWQAYGAPRKLELLITFDHTSPLVSFDLCWFDKPACRLPEAAWFTFNPRIPQPRGWQMEKLGQWVSPYDVIRNGNRHLHALGQGVRAEASGHIFSLDTLDTALAAPGQPALLDFNNRQPDLRQGWSFNLTNNLWGTNFPMWNEGDARFRFNLRIESM